MYGFESEQEPKVIKLYDELKKLSQETLSEVDALVKKFGIAGILAALIDLSRKNCDEKNPTLNFIADSLMSVLNRIGDFRHFDLVEKKKEPDKEDKKE